MINNTIEQLRQLGLHGMAEALEQQCTNSSFVNTPFDERVLMLANAEATSRENARYKRILRNSKLKFIATPEDISYRPDRELDRAVVAELLRCDWIENARNVLLTGATGTGKTWLACAIAVAAARKGITVAYRRIGPLLDDLAIAHEDGKITQKRNRLARFHLLLLDDFGLTPMSARGRADLFDLLDERVGASSTIVMAQLPLKEWHDRINDPAIADAILDRLVHNSYKLLLKGESMRKVKSKDDRKGAGSDQKRGSVAHTSG